MVRELIHRHSRDQSHRVEFDPEIAAAEVINPVCGDVVRVQLALEDGRVTQVRLGGHGCTLSQAAASMAADRLVGRSWDEIRALEADFNRMLQKDGEASADLGDLRALAGVSRFPNRVRCSRLVWDALDELDPQE